MEFSGNFEFISIHDLRYHVSFWGNPNKPKVFFFHGFKDSGQGFELLCRILEKDFFCIAPDLRGFGKTQHTPNPLGYFFYEYVADLHALFEYYSKEESLKLVGHSMGGNIISLYAGTFPEQVSHLVNIEGLGIVDRIPESGPTRLKKWVEGVGKASKHSYRDLNELSNKLQKRSPGIPEEYALFLAKTMLRPISKGYEPVFDSKHQWVNPYLFQLPNVAAFWKRIRAKCLFVLGQRTDWKSIFPVDNPTMEVKKRISMYPFQSQTIEIKNSGHQVHWEKPKELAKHIQVFLK